MKKTTFLLLLFLGSVAAEIRAQDPEFTQFYANQLYLNPAFAGAQRCKRVSINYRNQWPALSGQFITTSVSYDQYVCGIGGIGMLVTNDNAGEGTLRTLNASLLYAWHQPLTRTIQVSGGFQATYAEKRVDWDKLTFGDMIDPRHGFVYTTNEVEGRGIARYFDMSAGILLHSPRYFIGFSSHHLAEPDEFLLSGPSTLPRKYTGHAGAVIPVSSRDEITISPNVLYQMQGDFRQLNLGLYVNKGPITGGFWYRDQDSFIVLLGLQKNTYRVGYSYDVTVSRLSNATAGSHELSFQTTLSCKKCKKKFRTVVCPSF